VIAWSTLGPVTKGEPKVIYFRRVYPSLGSPEAMPGSDQDAPNIVARVGGGIASAYPSTDRKRVWLLRFGGKPWRCLFRPT
jgi:hypothetical protein